jgi:tRNA 2-thiouridine synthesizing protein A
MAGPEGSRKREKPSAVLDARGLQCPLPVLKARKALAELPPGALLSVMASDSAARIDMAHFCALSGHTLLSVDEAHGTLTFVIRRGKSR